jgi:glycosyltransferase involved in cell wall biosynthesis
MRFYYWIDNTGRQERSTGVQRVVCNLAQVLVEDGHDLVPVRWCPRREEIVLAEERWTKGLARFGGPNLTAGREAGTALHLASAAAGRVDKTWLLLPEVPHAGRPEPPNLAVVLDYARFHGLRTAAVFYDLIPLRQPGYEEMARAHELYARALAAADLVLAISAYSARDLERWWAEEHHDPARLPRVLALPLPEEIRGLPRVTDPVPLPERPVRFIAVGTVEPRKNQVEVIRAFARLRGRRPDLELFLDIVGGVHHSVADVVDRLTADEERIRLHEYVSDGEMHSLVAASHATVFTSLYEGFGLPIAESLWRGKPCLCSDHGSIREIAVGGGCLMVPAADGTAIERGLEQLADDAALRQRLAEEACSRELRSWYEYGKEVVAVVAKAPEFRRVVVIEGSRGDGSAADELSRAGVSVRRLHWRSDSGALLPGTVRAGEVPVPGAGQLHKEWAVLPTATTSGQEEAAEILRAARGLGLRVALEIETEVPPSLASEADLALFQTVDARNAALDNALSSLTRTVTIRERFRVGTGVKAPRAIADSAPRIAAAGALRSPRRLYYWVDLTVQQRFNTGVQRVTRLLAATLQSKGIEIVPVKWDDAARAIAPISAEDAACLGKWSGPMLVPPHPLPDRFDGEWMVLPEIAVPMVPPGSDVVSMAHRLGMRIAAIFYDLIPSKMPEIYSQAARDAFDVYWRCLADADLLLPISWTAAADIQRWLAEARLRVPPLVPCPLAGAGAGTPRITRMRDEAADRAELQLLAVGTWEPRKNYPRLLRALRSAQERARRPIRLTVVGRRDGRDALDAEIEELASLVAVDLRDHVSDHELRDLHEAASATVFASCEEGFGLPVLESTWFGRPCLCHSGSAMAELVPGGGVLAVNMLDETSIADGLVRLADEPGLLGRLTEEAVARPIRSWDEYADDVVLALARANSPPGWPLPAIVQRRPLLSCAITTYNRAAWLSHSLPRLLEVTRAWRDVVEVVVCDNASTDETPDVVAQFRGETNFAAHRNGRNVGMLGNLGATARASRGAFVWLLGDDDLLTDGSIENVLDGLASHPDVEMAYMNYAYTLFDAPNEGSIEQVMADATPIAAGGPNRYVSHLRDVAGLNENLFTAIYTSAFRRDHALRAYQLDTRGDPFTSLATCVPSSVYALAALQDRPVWWVGDPAVVVNMNVSWLRWELLWRLERMPELYATAERQGVDPMRLDCYRLQHLAEAERWVRTAYLDAEEVIRTNFSMARLLERSKHLPELQERHLAGLRRAYRDAWHARRVVEDPIPPDELFAKYGL